MKLAERVSWRPAPDEELTWFRAGGALPSQPRPLDYTCEVAAFSWGLTQAFTISYWPLYEVRARLIAGHLYLATVPSPHAERNLENRIQLTRETPLRYMRDLRAAWEREGRREVDEYNQRMAAFPPADLSGAELGEALFRLKRVRADQWCAPVRAVTCPAVICMQGYGETPRDEAIAVAEEARELLRRGGAIFGAALDRTGRLLARAGCIEAPGDIAWLEYAEVRAALEQGGAYQETVATRRSQAGNVATEPGPARIGPRLPTDAPCMYLVREVLDLIGVDLAREEN